MLGGFHIGIDLIDAQATGLQLIEAVHIADGRWGERLPRPMVAHVKLADWLMTAPDTLPPLVEGYGIRIGDLLTGAVPVKVEQAAYLEKLTGGAIVLQDWLVPYSGAAIPPDQAAAPLGDGVASASSPTRDGLGQLPPAVTSPIVHGVLGETPGGPLFTVVRGDPWRPYVLTGLGCSWAWSESQAQAAFRSLAQALGYSIADAGR